MAGERKLLFSVSNRHPEEGCGKPPAFLTDTTDQPVFYHSYFANKYGEQFVFKYNHETGDAILFGGDIDWETPQKVTAAGNEVCAGVVLSEPESWWLVACCLACGVLKSSDQGYRVVFSES